MIDALVPIRSPQARRAKAGHQGNLAGHLSWQEPDRPSRSYTRPVTVEGKSFVKCEYETRLAIKRFGQSLQVETRRETIDSPMAACSRLTMR